MIITAARGPLICLIISLLVYTLLTVKLKIRQKILLIFLTFSIIAIIFNYLPEKTYSRYIQLLHGEGTVANRLSHYRVGIELFKENPLWGIGFGQFGKYSIFKDSLFYPHNMLLQLLCEFGIIGFSIFILILWWVLSKFFKIYFKSKLDHYSKNIVCFVVVLFIFNFIESLFSGRVGDNFYLMISLGLTISTFTHYPNIIENNQVDRFKRRMYK
jgi:O-antigen ligase